MLKLIKTYTKYFFLWVAYFFLARLLFFIYLFDSTQKIGTANFFESFLYGSRLDMSVAGYFSVIPFALMAIGSLLPKERNFFHKIAEGFTYLLVFVASVLVVLDLELYKNWRFRLDDTFIRTMQDGSKEVMASSGAAPIKMLLTLIIVLTAITIYAFKKGIFNTKKDNVLGNPSEPYPLSTRALKMVLGLIIMVAMILPIRGGVQLAPVNQSAVYFSDKTFANHAAVNAIWNFMVSCYEKTSSAKNPYIYMPQSEAQTTLKSLFQDSKITEYLIKKDIKNPNVIVITWESLTAKAIQHLDSKESYVPNVDSLCKEGILFSNIYASGDRTFMGMSAVLAGQPAIPGENILEVPRKSAQLPCMSKNLRKMGYETGFYYGGESEFANMKSYLMNGQFNHFVDKHQFKEEELSSKWGAFDHVVFERASSDLKTYKQPFFINILTLSSHEPFEVPAGFGMPNFQPTTDNIELFKNSLYYCDQGFGAFIKNAQQQPWWDNTLIVVIADHGTPRLPPHDDDFLNYHIPMLWLGGALAVKDTVIDRVGGQIDLAATVLSQLDTPHDDFRWSKNIMQKNYQPFAYFTFRDGFGFMQKDVKYSWDTEGLVYRQKIGKPDSTDLHKGKAFLQSIFQDFLNK
jgi:phosphoglycerol transferase MdoB-like AlkP superfamily enzyme